MGRPPTPVGTFGTIATKRLPSGKWKAQTRVRDYDGRSRQVERSAATKTAAVNALKAAIAERDPLPSYVETSPTTTVADLGTAWIESLRQEDRVRGQTIDRYRTNITHSIVPALGEYRLRELSAARCERFFMALTPGAGREAAKVLRLMLDVAVRHDAIRVNPARQAKAPGLPGKNVQTISIPEIIDLRNRVGLWLAGEIDNDGKPRKKSRYGPNPRPELLDILDLYLATGVRTSELLASRWREDVNLAVDPVELTVSGTLVHVTGQGLVRQESPKTESGFRTLLLPPFGAEILRRRYIDRRCNIVFPSESDTFLHPSNVNRVWRKARSAAGYPTLELRTIRRTVATAIDADHGAGAAAEQLGHRGTAVTERHYIAPSASRAPDLTETLQRFAARSVG